ncbi:MAG: hypothetical protein ACT4QA_04410 [Panacagrimonas sp.]
MHPLLVLAVLLLGWFVLDRGLAAVMRQVLLDSDYRISRVYAGTIDAEVVLVGNSRAAHLIDPRQLSARTCLKVFNLGVDGIDAMTQAAIVKDYLDRNRAPRLMIFEVSNARFDEASVAAEFSPFIAFSDRLRPLIAADSGWTVAHDLFHLYAFNSPKWWRAAVTWFAADDQDDPPSHGQLRPDLGQTALQNREWRVGEEKIAAIQDAMRYALARKVRVLATLAPYHLAAFGGERSVQTEYAESIYSRLPEGVTIADLSTSFSGHELFADRVHINKAGMAALQPKMVELIKAQLGDRCG